MSGSNPKYLPIPKKIPYNIRLPKPLLDKLNAYAELTGNTTTDVVIGALNDAMKDKTVFNDYLPYIKGITIKIPIKADEKLYCSYNNIINPKIYGDFVDNFGYDVTTAAYEILKIPNNLDVFNDHLGYHTMIDNIGRKGNHSGIEFVVIPEIAMDNDNVFDALYCFYFETKLNKLEKVVLIDYLDAINKANESENLKLKNNLVSCVKELQKLNLELENTFCDDIDAIENYTFETVTAIADKYNTGNVIPLGENIDESIVAAEIKANPEYVNGIIYDKVELIVGEKYDDYISEKVAEIVDEKLSAIEKLVIDAESKDEILSAISENKIKTKKD